MGRGGGQEDQPVKQQSAAVVTRNSRNLGDAFDIAHQRAQLTARWATPFEVSERRASSLVFTDGTWKVIELFADKLTPQKTELQVDDPSDLSAIETAYQDYLARARQADAEAGYALAAA